MSCQLINENKLISAWVNLDETTYDIVSLDWVKFSDNSEEGHKFPDCWYEIIKINGPRNGIYCLHECCRKRDHAIALMNVSLREFKLLPKPEEWIIWNIDSQIDFVEIGFDHKTNDYKVFIFKENLEGEHQAAVYHVSSNSWIKLSDPLLESVVPYPLCDSEPDTYVDGYVHWLASEGELKGHCDWCILSFDMVGEVFAKMELPADLRINWDENMYVVARYDESLSLIVYQKTPDNLHEISYTKCFDIWVMKDYGNERSWSREFTTGPVEDVDILLGIWRNGELLIQHKNRYTISYDPSNQKMEQLCFGEGFHLMTSRIYLLREPSFSDRECRK